MSLNPVEYLRAYVDGTEIVVWGQANVWTNADEFYLTLGGRTVRLARCPSADQLGSFASMFSEAA